MTGNTMERAGAFGAVARRRRRSAALSLDPPHQRGLVIHPVLGHARGSAKGLDVGEVRGELANLWIQLANQGVELFGSWLGERVLVIGHVHLPASGGGTLVISDQPAWCTGEYGERSATLHVWCVTRHESSTPTGHGTGA